MRCGEYVETWHNHLVLAEGQRHSSSPLGKSWQDRATGHRPSNLLDRSEVCARMLLVQGTCARDLFPTLLPCFCLPIRHCSSRRPPNMLYPRVALRRVQHAAGSTVLYQRSPPGLPTIPSSQTMKTSGPATSGWRRYRKRQVESAFVAPKSCPSYLRCRTDSECPPKLRFS